MKTHPSPRFASAGRHTAQRGVVLLFALIALLVLMIGAVALVRSFSSTMDTTGNVAFKKDLVTRNEALIARVLNLARQPTNLTLATNSANTMLSMNYSPQILDSNPQGIPQVLLLGDTAFNASGFASSANDIAASGDGIRLRFVIDRQCNSAGLASALGATNCAVSDGGTPKRGGSADNPIRAETRALNMMGASRIVPVYRLSIRATGPKGVMSFYQTTFTLE